MDDWFRVRLGSVGGDLVATPLPRGAGVLTSLVRADGLLVVPAGVEGHHAGSTVSVELLRGLDEIARTIVAIGSHDLVLDLAASALRADDPLVTLASSNVGSLGGLVALRDGLCHIAGSHLLDTASGEYTLPYVDRVFGSSARTSRRATGAPGAGADGGAGQPARGSRTADAAGRAVRQPAARRRNPGPPRPPPCGARHPADAISGYAREEPTHLAVAAAIAAGRGDAGLGITAAARAFGLTSCRSPGNPTTCVTPGALGSPLLKPLWALLHSDQFQAAVTGLGGYSAKEMGRRLR